MTKIIKIGNKSVKLDNNATWLLEYKAQFGKDILPVIMPMISTLIETASTIISEVGELKGVTAVKIAEALKGQTLDALLPLYQADFEDVVINVTWAMAKAADENLDPPRQWLRTLDGFPVDIIIPALFELLGKGFISSKNLKRLGTMKTDLSKIAKPQPSQQTTSSSQQQSEV